MNNGHKGKLIILDGIDGCGGETQTKLLKENLEKDGHKVKIFESPNYDRPAGKLLDNFLHSEYQLSPEFLTLIYYADFVDTESEIEKALSENYIAICDRYVTTTMAYQAVQGIKQEQIEQLLKAIPIPKPDIAIYLSISAETSAKRKFAEKGNLDRFEKDLEFLTKITSKYIENAKNNIYCKQEIVNAEKPIKEVAQDIYSAIIPIIKNHQ